MRASNEEILLAPNEEIIKEYNYIKNGSRLIITNRRIISHTTCSSKNRIVRRPDKYLFSVFNREEMPIEDVNSIGTSYEVIRKRITPIIINCVIGLILLVITYLLFKQIIPTDVNAFQKIFLFRKVDPFRLYVYLLCTFGFFFFINLVVLLSSLIPIRVLTLNIKAKGILTDCISFKAVSRTSSKRFSPEFSNDCLVMIRFKVDKNVSLQMINEIGAVIMEQKEKTEAEKAAKQAETKAKEVEIKVSYPTQQMEEKSQQTETSSQNDNKGVNEQNKKVEDFRKIIEDDDFEEEYSGNNPANTNHHMVNLEKED